MTLHYNRLRIHLAFFLWSKQIADPVVQVASKKVNLSQQCQQNATVNISQSHYFQYLNTPAILSKVYIHNFQRHEHSN